MNLHNDADIARSPDFPMSLYVGTTSSLTVHRRRMFLAPIVVRVLVSAQILTPSPRGVNMNFLTFILVRWNPLLSPLILPSWNWRHSPWTAWRTWIVSWEIASRLSPGHVFRDGCYRWGVSDRHCSWSKLPSVERKHRGCPVEHDATQHVVASQFRGFAMAATRWAGGKTG